MAAGHPSPFTGNGKLLKIATKTLSNTLPDTVQSVDRRVLEKRVYQGYCGEAKCLVLTSGDTATSQGRYLGGRSFLNCRLGWNEDAGEDEMRERPSEREYAHS